MWQSRVDLYYKKLQQISVVRIGVATEISDVLQLGQWQQIHYTCYSGFQEASTAKCLVESEHIYVVDKLVVVASSRNCAR